MSLSPECTHTTTHTHRLRLGLDAQASVDAPRFAIQNADTERDTMTSLVDIESGFGIELLDELRAMGHDLNVLPEHDAFERGSAVGKAQIIALLPGGALCAGSDPRADGCAFGY